ncbi:hypothetical protein C8J56DRAFT_1170341 [Mycena floridula]|nr:hypothetical protein C8J56DRAFT_1170341 [Mycena floridula]
MCSEFIYYPVIEHESCALRGQFEICLGRGPPSPKSTIRRNKGRNGERSSADSQNRGRNHFSILVRIVVLSERYVVRVAPGVPLTAIAHLASLTRTQRDALEFIGDRRVNLIIDTLLLRYNLPANIHAAILDQLKSNKSFTQFIINLGYSHPTTIPPYSVEGKDAANSLEKLVGLMISEEVGMAKEAELRVEALFTPIINGVIFGIEMARRNQNILVSQCQCIEENLKESVNCWWCAMILEEAPRLEVTEVVF